MSEAIWCAVGCACGFMVGLLCSAIVFHETMRQQQIVIAMWHRRAMDLLARLTDIQRKRRHEHDDHDDADWWKT